MLIPRLAAALAALLIAPLTALAGPEGAARIEVLRGWRTSEGTHMAALHISLAEGWKTYWRAPGEAGIPPVFNWSGSTNLASVRVHWPSPHVFHQNGMTSIGYTRDLVLPIELTPSRPGAPIALQGALEFGICETICVPVTAKVAAELPPGRTGPDARIRGALAQRPLSAVEAGAGTVTCALSPTKDGLSVRAEVDLPDMGGNETAVIETGDPALWVSEASVDRQGGRLAATAEILPAGRGPVAVDRSALRLTVIGASGAVDLRGCG
ncbi:hypothetical protein EKE94_05380 [Mesobaculum littorinae]|uniref:Thiol:disulfide interchange protein DsbD N-terminal domain-containing protein n=1 Tax=Mesobaculum littorinae TaxID=2486419 RepID=A0A438AI95_9RHOB|nr:protein-disulfide reductase DsbD domain-containing protein [Mesobaculum littorinae]RVV98358.1 hypothetical protein EKE94_05380 [Mesobaculum littorinae]